MGTSTDAILAFGIDIGEVYYDEFTRICEELGIKDEDEYGEVDLGEALHTAFSETKFKLITHCSSGCRMYVIALRDTNYVVSRGDSEEIEQFDLKELREKWNKACVDKFAFLKKEEPKMLLCSYWG